MADKSVSIDLVIKSSEAASSLKEVKQSLKDIKDAMIGAGEGSAQFNKLAQAAAKLKDKVDDSNEAIAAMNPNKFQAVASFAASAAGGISAVTGAMGLFGEQSEEVTKTLAKVQSAMALSQGLASLSELPKAFNSIKVALGFTTVAQKVKNVVDAEAVVVTEGQVVATKQLEVAQKSQGLASKIAAGFQYALNLAMSLNPIGLIIAGVAILVGVLFALKDKFKPIQLYFDAIATGVKFIIQGIKDAMDWLGLSSFADDEASEKKLKNINKIKDAQSEASDHEIRMAKAAGKNVEELEQKKRKDIIDGNKLAMAEILRHAIATNSYTDAQKKQYKELAIENKKMNEDIEEANIKHDTKLKEDAAKKKADDDKKIADNLQKQKDAARAINLEKKRIDEQFRTSQLSDEEKQLEDFVALQKTYLNNGNITEGEYNQKIIDKRRELYGTVKSIDVAASEEFKVMKSNDAFTAIQIAQFEADEKIRIEKEKIAEEKAIRKKEFTDKLELALKLNEGLQSLSDMAFTIKMHNTKKGSAEEEKALRAQFKINKALQLSSVIIQGILAAQTAYAAGVAAGLTTTGGVASLPMGAIYAGVSIAGTLAAVAKIAATQFDTTSVGSLNSGGGGGGGPTPDLNAGAATATSNSQPSTLLNPDGTVANNNNNAPTPIQVYVVESDITSTQQRVNVVQNQMSFQ